MKGQGRQGRSHNEACVLSHGRAWGVGGGGLEGGGQLWLRERLRQRLSRRFLVRAWGTPSTNPPAGGRPPPTSSAPTED